jgi:hypothetical protein
VNKLFKKSKWLHKYLGLLLILFLMWESISGIILNHPELVANISVPGLLVPEHYHIKNWNRSSLIKLLYSKKDSNQVYTCGKLGVWKSSNGGKSFYSFMKNYPSSPYLLKTNDIFLYSINSEEYLFAATDGGLFACNTKDGLWKNIRLNEESEKVKKLLKIDSNLVVITESNGYITNFNNFTSLNFANIEKLPLEKSDKKRTVTLVELFFHIHDGRIWGLPGKLLFDIVGIIIFFLSISAFYAWYFPKMLKRKRTEKIQLKKSEKKAFKFLFKYHLKLGIWAGAIILIIAGTGFFMRPPMLVLIATGSVSSDYYPGVLPSNPWHEKIHTALYDPVDKKIILETTDGIYTSSSTFSESFHKDSLNVPMFVMGATIFDTLGHGGYLIGSFNGLFHLERATGKPIDMLTGKETGKISNVRPAEKMITGYFKTPQGEEFITTHEQGLLPIGNSKLNGRFKMPTEMESKCRMPLWNYMFEIHNGRFFKSIIGNFYILLVPFGSLLFFIVTLTGIFDWFVVRKK